MNPTRNRQFCAAGLLNTGLLVNGKYSAFGSQLAVQHRRMRSLLSLASVMGPGCCHEEGTTWLHE
jgi:hypothetical protein